MNIVSCPPVTTVLIKRPDLKYQLGFSVQNGIVSIHIVYILLYIFPTHTIIIMCGCMYTTEEGSVNHLPIFISYTVAMQP